MKNIKNLQKKKEQKSNQNTECFDLEKTFLTYFVGYSQCTEVRFASFLSGWFIITIVVNPPERKLEKRTSVQCGV